MKKNPWVPIGVFALIIFSGCGPQLDVPTVSSDLLQREQVLQKEMFFKTTMERHIRLNRVYTRIAITGAELCGKQLKPVLGFVKVDRGSLSEGKKEWAIRTYNINEGIKIIDVVPGLPAAEGGLEPGDVILDMAQGANVSPTIWGWSTFTLKDFRRIVSRAGRAKLSLLVRRKGKIFVTRITPKLACSYNAQVAIADPINAMADGERIVVTTGALNFTRNDDELAIIVGHEVAHNALKHIDRQKANIMIGSLLGTIFDIGLAAGAGVNTGGVGSDLGSKVGSFAYSQDFEIEADYMGLYLVARAGFDISKAPDLIRRMGVEHPESIRKNYFATHPSTPERAAVMQKTLQEIRAKVRMGKSLVPTKLEATSEEKMAHKDKDPEPVGDRVKLESQPAETQVLQESASMGKKHHEPKKKPVEQQAALQEDAATVKRHGTLELTGGPVGSAGISLEAEFLDSGKGQGQARIIYPNMYMLHGQYWTIGAGQIFQGLVNPTLMNPDSLKGYSKNDLKGFAAYSGSDGTTMECVYVIPATSEISEGTCIDNQGNQYRLVISKLSAVGFRKASQPPKVVVEDLIRH